MNKTILIIQSGHQYPIGLRGFKKQYVRPFEAEGYYGDLNPDLIIFETPVAQNSEQMRLMLKSFLEEAIKKTNVVAYSTQSLSDLTKFGYEEGKHFNEYISKDVVGEKLEKKIYEIINPSS